MCRWICIKIIPFIIITSIILTKILNILTANATTNNRSYLPRSLVQLDSNLNRL